MHTATYTKELSHQDFSILLFKRHMDDCISRIPKDKIPDLVKSFNNFRLKVQCIQEIEEKHCLNFWDFTLISNATKKNLKQNGTYN